MTPKRWIWPALALPLLVLTGQIESVSAVPPRQITPPSLTIADQIPSVPNALVDVPVVFDSGENSVTSTLFSIDFNQGLLSFNPVDANMDGIPDNIVVTVPAGYTVGITYNSGDSDGEIDVTIFDSIPPLGTLPDGQLISIRFLTGSPPLTQDAFVGFSSFPAPSFSGVGGGDIPGDGIDGSVRIVVPGTGTPSPTSSPTSTNTGTVSPTATTTSTATNTNTPTRTSTPTASNTLPPGVTPSATNTATATGTATSTGTATRTATRTATATSGPSPTATRTPTASATLPPGVTPSATRTATRTPTRTVTPGPSPTARGGAILIGQRLLDATPSYGDTTVLVDGTPAAQTQEDGWFVVLNPLPGNRVVELRYPGALPSRGSFNVPAGKVVFLGQTKLVLGDVYPNNVIDRVDIDLVRAALGRCKPEQSYQAFLDLNKDGCIDTVDLTIVVTNEGITGPTRWTTSPP